MEVSSLRIIGIVLYTSKKGPPWSKINQKKVILDKVSKEFQIFHIFCLFIIKTLLQLHDQSKRRPLKSVLMIGR